MVFPAKRGMRYALFKTQIERTTFKIILIINSLKAYIAGHLLIHLFPMQLIQLVLSLIVLKYYQWLPLKLLVLQQHFQ